MQGTSSANSVKMDTKEEKPWRDYSNNQDMIVEKINRRFKSIKIGDETFLSNQVMAQLQRFDVYTPDRTYFMLSQQEYLKIFNIPYDGPRDPEEFPLMNLKKFSKFFGKFVIRSISTSTGHQVLTDEILELIPVVMEKQGVPLEEYEKKLRSYSEKWDSGRSVIFNSVDVSFFKIIMDSLKVDRDLITIIPDPYHYLGVRRASVGSAVPMRTMVNDSKYIICRGQAIYHIFRNLVCSVHWKSESEKNVDKVNDFKKKYFKQIDKFESLRKGAFVAEEYLGSSVDVLISYRFLLRKIDNYVDKKNPHVNKLEMEDIFRTSECLNRKNMLHLPEESEKHRKFLSTLSRSYFLLAWIQSFYPKEMFERKRALVTELAFHFPVEERERQKNNMMLIIENLAMNADQEREETEMEKLVRLVNRPENVEKVKKIFDMSELYCELEKTVEPIDSIEPDESMMSLGPKKPKVPVEHIELKQPVQEIPKKKEPVVAKPKPKPPSPCKCSENGINLLKAREALKKAENLAKRHEGKAKRTEKVENDFEKMTQKMKELEKEMEELGIELEEADEMERKMRVSNKQLMDEIGQLEGKLKSEQENTVDAHQRSSVIKQKVEGLQVKLVLRESQMEARKKNVKGSNDAEPSTLHVQHVPKLGTTDDPVQAANPDWHLEQWRKLKEECEKDDMIQEEKTAIDRLLAKVEDHEVKTMVEHELIQFEGTLKIYLQNIEMNINKIEKTRDFSNLQPISKYPSLSKKFVIEFERQMGIY